MMTTAKRVCSIHKDVLAVARCCQCGKPACHDCIIEVEGQSFCSMVCLEQNQAFPSQAFYKKKPLGILGKLSRLVIYLLVVALIILIGGKVFGIEFCVYFLKGLKLM